MKVPRLVASAALASILLHAPDARSAAPAPPFDVAYRAWEIVTELARHNGDPAIGGECVKTFRPFVIPALRKQTRQEQDVAASACFEAARAACTNARLRRPAAVEGKCGEFRSAAPATAAPTPPGAR